MRIVFDLHDVGLGNNGGSRTIIRCAEVISNLGNEVVLYSNYPSKYTWHNPENIVITNKEKHFHGDVVIATGYHSVNHVVSSKIKKKFYYIRGFEIWQVNEKQLVDSYKKLKCIVNSQYMHDYLKRSGICSKVVYQGLDFDRFFIISREREKCVGAIYSERHSTKRHTDAIAVCKILGCPLKLLNKDFFGKNDIENNQWYNKIHVWFSPSELEGLHNPPMEASLSGCGLVCTDAPRGGTVDFAIHNETCLTYHAGDLKAAADRIDHLFNDNKLLTRLNQKMICYLQEKIGSRKKNMSQMLEYFQQ